MKKYLSFLLILVSILLLSTTNITYANTIEPFDVIDVSNTDYDLQISVINSTAINQDGNAYVGQILGDYIIRNFPTYKLNMIYQKVEWENPNYKIVEGYQDVNLLVKDYTSNVTIVTFIVRIYGINQVDSNQPNLKLNKLYGGRNVIEYKGFINDSKNSFIPHYSFLNSNGEVIDGTVTYQDFDNSKEGKYDIVWVFTPYDTSYETKTGTVNITITQSEEVTITPTLTATSLILAPTSSTYDININNKETGSTYRWSSSDEKVAKVDTKGVVTSIGDGICEITCVITNSGEVQELKSTVTVGSDDDNLPVLSETDLSLEINDIFDIDADNLVKGSKVKFTSSDKTVAKVTSTTGKITGLSEGNCFITVIITTTDKQVIILKCDVEVTK